jgi:hypothetical protein
MAPFGWTGSGVTTEGMGARSMPEVTPKPTPGQPEGSSSGPMTGPGPRQPAKGSEVRVIRCAIHGIAYDGEREVCPECAKGEPPPRNESASRNPAS